MEVVGNDAYVDMSLDDVIRQMKAKKAKEEKEQGLINDNSVFFRRPQSAQHDSNCRPFMPFGNNRRSIGFGRPGNQNYYARFARKKVQQAHKTLDLRRRLIHLRATKEGLDLRWKIVANMVMEMRNRARANPRIQPYPQRPSYLSDITAMPAMQNSQGYRSSVSQIERLVGRLPPWMKNPNYYQQQQQQTLTPGLNGGIPVLNPRHENGGGPFARPRAYYPVRHVQPPPSVIPLCYIPKPHPVPSIHHSQNGSCASYCASNHSQSSIDETDPLMPPLAPQQPSHPCQVPYFGSQMQKRNPPFTHAAPAREPMLAMEHEDSIEFTVINENCPAEEVQPLSRTSKMTLNQRFMGVN